MKLISIIIIGVKKLYLFLSDLCLAFHIAQALHSIVFYLDSWLFVTSI